MDLLIKQNYAMVLRQDKAEYLKDYFKIRYQIPMHLSERKSHQRMSGFLVRKHLPIQIKTKIHSL